MLSGHQTSKVNTVSKWVSNNLMNIHLWIASLPLWDQLVTNQICHFHRVYDDSFLPLDILSLQYLPRCQNRGFWGYKVDPVGSQTCHVAVHVCSMCQYTCNTIRFWAIDMYMLLDKNSSILGHILSQYASFHECAVFTIHLHIYNRVKHLGAFLMLKTSYQHPEATNTVQLNLILLTECPTSK